MASVTLFQTKATFTIPALQAMTKCSLFQKNPRLTVSPCGVQCPVFLSIFREFLFALEENAINMTDRHFSQLHRFNEQFDSSEIGASF
jgi:hypothetical protein